MGSLLAGIEGPRDLKLLPVERLGELADELRASIVAYVNGHGGHYASNLGVVELTIALHYVFDAPRDKLVFDVSHQSYAHKMLTGRRRAFCDPACYGSVSGFTDPDESDFDLFKVGHSSTGISLACGLAHARNLRGETHAVVAVVGDGALSGGESFEGLNNAAVIGGGTLIVINDNECSIASNVGGLYANLAELRATGGTSEHNLFRELGLDYRYVEQGNDVVALVRALEGVRGATRPTVLHVHTTKGYGDPWAEAHPEEAHELRAQAAGAPTPEECAYAAMAEHLVELAQADPRLVVVSPATPLSHGLTPALRTRLGRQFVDVGIAEAHAVTFAAALARGGAHPVLCVSSTFLQRAYDQLVEDLALGRLPVVVLCYKAGLADRDATHVGSLDVAYASSIPGLTCLAPRDAAEATSLLDGALASGAGPVLIRMPRGRYDLADAPLAVPANVGRWHVVSRGSKVAFVTLGDEGGAAAEAAARLLADRHGISPTIACATTYSSVDDDLLRSLERDHTLLVVVEDAMADGGLGQRVAAACCNRPLRVLARGGAREFTQRVALDEQLRRYRMTPEQLACDVCGALGECDGADG